MLKNLINEWNQKEEELINSNDYKNACENGKEELLYNFNINKEEAFNQFFKEKYYKEQGLKEAFIKLFNYCKHHSPSCENCIFVDDNYCILNMINDYPSLGYALDVIDKNIKRENNRTGEL